MNYSGGGEASQLAAALEIERVRLAGGGGGRRRPIAVATGGGGGLRGV